MPAKKVKTTSEKSITKSTKGPSKSTKGPSKTPSVKIETVVETVKEVVPKVGELVVTETQSNSSSLETNVHSVFSQLVDQSDDLAKSHKKMTSNLKRVFKYYLKECKDLKKASTKSRRKSTDPNKAKRAPSGFAKPTNISTTLCDFLDVPHGFQMARTEVTKKVTGYIKDQNLQVPENKRRFVPDTKLQSVLGPLDTKTIGKDGKTDGEKGYTYFNLQKYLSAQFPKKIVSA